MFKVSLIRVATSKIVGNTEKSNGFFEDTATRRTITDRTILNVNNASNSHAGNGKITIDSIAKSIKGMAV
jgi:hypothetical protein